MADSKQATSSRYATWLDNGLNVVTPNKKTGSGDLQYYKQVKKTANTKGTHWMYETTVGAGLPIIDTLQGLLETGDEVCVRA